MKPPAKSFFLFGPRGTGKTTWLRQHFPEAEWFDLLRPSEFLRFSRQPELFRKELEAIPSGKAVVIDEMQKLPLLLDDVHHFLSDRQKKLSFVLTGSSARKLKRSGANLLAGRAVNRHFYPLVAAEHGQIDRIEQILKFGTLPEVLNQPTDRDRVDFLEAYASNYLREEIQQEAMIRSVESFSRFLQVAGIMNGQILNFSSIARDSGASRTTLLGYYGVLEDTLAGNPIRAWQPRIRIKEVGHPKFYFFDPGVVRALSGRLRQELEDFEKGFLLETYVLHELRAWNEFLDLDAKISYWKTPSKVEVDFIVEAGGAKIGIEVKSSSTWKREFGKPLNQLLEEKSLTRAYGVFLGVRPQLDGGVEVLPLKAFLAKLAKGALF
ncbi:MAG: DUF4143 domain-containing protein [Oligoflexia bacterium]|nr:DUF4143 domain-containing protein [Oligoflexia bacterium]